MNGERAESATVKLAQRRWARAVDIIGIGVDGVTIQRVGGETSKGFSHADIVREYPLIEPDRGGEEIVEVCTTSDMDEANVRLLRGWRLLSTGHDPYGAPHFALGRPGRR